MNEHMDRPEVLRRLQRERSEVAQHARRAPWIPAGAPAHHGPPGNFFRSDPRRMFHGADGVRSDPRFVRRGMEGAEAGMAGARLALQREHQQLLAVEEELTRRRARESRLARYADGRDATVGGPQVGRPRHPPGHWPAQAPILEQGLESVHSTLREQQWEIEALARDCRRLSMAWPYPQQSQLYAVVPSTSAEGLRVSIEPNEARAPRHGVYGGLYTVVQRRNQVSRCVAWVAHSQAREAGNAQHLRELQESNEQARQQIALCSREIDEYNRQTIAVLG